MSFLQYVDMNSFLHKLDPRTKFIFFISISILTSLVKNGVALLLVLVFMCVVWFISKTGKYMIDVLVKLKVLLLFILLLWLVLGAFEVNKGIVLYATTFCVFSKQFIISFELFDIYKGAVFALRIYLMISSFYTIIISTNFSEIILGLRSLKVPYGVAFGIGLIFQIIPIIITEFNAIMHAQSSRGLEVEKCSLAKKIRNYVTLSLPLMFRALSKGHSISMAMYYYKLDLKKERTSYKKIIATYKDYVFLALTGIMIVGTVVLNYVFHTISL